MAGCRMRTHRLRPPVPWTSRGIWPKTAAYGLLRFSLPLFPNASAEFAPIAMWLGVIGIFYGAWMAFAQTDIKRLIAYTPRFPTWASC